jgi:4-amino-4-deoxy-L-arabinose transferase-like glycosyltransferase
MRPATDSAGERPATRLPVWATPLGCAVIVVLLTLPRIILSARAGLIGDEAYYAVWSLDPGFGHYDHAPAVAWVIWLGRMLFGEGEFAVRSLFLVSSFVTGALLYRMAVLLFADARIGAAAAIAYAVTPAAVITFAVATPDGPSTLFWLLAIWAVAEAERGRNPNWWLAVGAFAGLGLLSKYTVAFLGVGLLVYLLSSRDRRAWLGHWQVWAGGLLALLAFLPVVWIDAHRDWISFRFQLGRSTLDERRFTGFDDFIRFLVELSIQLLPTLFVLAAIAFVAFFARRARSLALPLLTTAPMLGYFLVHALFGRANSNWAAPMYPPLALLGAWAAFALRPEAGWLRWATGALRLLHVPLGVAALCATILAVETRGLPIIGPIPAINYLYGWDNLERRVAAIARAEGAAWLDAPDFSLAGAIGYYSQMAGDPLPVFQSNAAYRYAYRPPFDAAMLAGPHLVMRYANGSTPPVIAGARFVAEVTRDDDSGTPLGRYFLYLAGNPPD